MNGIANDVAAFMTAGDQSTQTFNARQTAFYVGMQLEELAEKLAAIGAVGQESQAIVTLSEFMERAGKAFKRGDHDMLIQGASTKVKADMVDADFDLAWVSIAASLSMGVPIHDVHSEGAGSNLSKIGPDGKCIKDENGKIQKPPGWRKPDFEQFVVA
jgi:predicted HAD superfamily Cof-like phosphohydrolase